MSNTTRIRVNQSVQQIASSMASLELERINTVLQQRISSDLKKVCNTLSGYIEKDLLNIIDYEDLWAFRKKLSVITEFVDYAISASPERSSNWAEPLIRECYRLCGISQDRTILIIHNVNSRRQKFGVIPNVSAKILNSPAVDSSNPSEEESFPPGKIDIFVIPASAKYDLATIALLAHEVGHVYWQQDKHVKEIEAAVSFRFKNTPTKSANDIKSIIDRMTRHIEEFLCDHVGSFLLGPAFDYALLRLFRSMPLSSASKTHPSNIQRIHRSQKHLKTYAEHDKNMGAKFIGLLDEIVRDNSVNATEDFYAKMAIDIASELHINSTLATNPIHNPININKLMTKVYGELNAFRPPFETVSKDWPELITPVEAVIGSILYFHTGEYKNNDFFTAQDKQKFSEEIRGEFEVKISVLRQKLIDHVHYAISLYDFVKNTQEKPTPSEFAEIQDQTLWILRGYKNEPKKTPLVVTPTTAPKSQYGQNSIDLRLGTSFLISVPSRYTHVDPYPNENSHPLKNHFKEVHIPVGDDFILHPHQFVLASILEYVCIPHDHFALILGRSTWGRLGLNIATATTVQADYRGCLTLELRNLGESPLPLKTGVRIAQLCLIKMPTERVVATGGYFNKGLGKYIGPVAAGIPMINEDKDWEFLANYLRH